jgi:outer membrane protein assembly factor BamB
VDAQGTIYAGIALNPPDEPARGLLVAVNAATHRIKWQYPAEAPVECTPVIGDDGVLYFGDNAGTIHAIDAQGQGMWRAEFGIPIRSAGAIVAPGQVAFGLDDGSLAVLRCSSQQLAQGGWPKLHGP